MRKILVLSVVAALMVLGLVLGADQAQADTITTADGNGADAYVETRSGTNSADNNYGDVWRIMTRVHLGLELYRKSYLRFDLSGITEEIISAGFEVTSTNNDCMGEIINVYGLTDGVTGEGVPGGGGWIESGDSSITWNNAPANASGTGVTTDATLLGTFAKGGADETTVFTDPNLVTFLNNDSNGLVTLIVGPSSPDVGGDCNWYAKEDGVGAPPALSLTVVPEPSSFITLIVAAVGLLGFRWRRRR